MEVYIKAVSYYLPLTVVDNDALQSEIPEMDVYKTAKAVGVSSRSIASDDETAVDLAEQAALKLFQEYGISKSEIGFIILCTQCPDYFLPSSACLLQNRLGIPTTAGAFDFNLGCSGYVYGLSIAKGLISSGVTSNVLLLTTDTLSKYLHPSDSNRVLFGDGASATLIATDGVAKIGNFILGTNGGGYENLILRTGGMRHRSKTGNVRIDEEGKTIYEDYLYMNGTEIFNFSVDLLPSLIEQTLVRNGLEKEDVNYYIFHQANQHMLNFIRKLCEIPKESYFVDLSDTGNTASTTIPIGLKKAIHQKRIRKEDKVMIAGFGVGLSWGATMLYF
jgi:3-oxoacyl-[acyl-carrier-protein] synthase-3